MACETRSLRSLQSRSLTQHEGLHHLRLLLDDAGLQDLQDKQLLHVVGKGINYSTATFMYNTFRYIGPDLVAAMIQHCQCMRSTAQ